MRKQCSAVFLSRVPASQQCPVAGYSIPLLSLAVWSPNSLLLLSMLNIYWASFGFLPLCRFFFSLKVLSHSATFGFRLPRLMMPLLLHRGYIEDNNWFLHFDWLFFIEKIFKSFFKQIWKKTLSFPQSPPPPGTEDVSDFSISLCANWLIIFHQDVKSSLSHLSPCFLCNSPLSVYYYYTPFTPRPLSLCV